MQNKQTLYDLTEQDWDDLGNMIVGDTTAKVNYFEEEYRELQLDPRYLDIDEKSEIMSLRNQLGNQLAQWIAWEDKFSNMTSDLNQELCSILREGEIDKILENNLKLVFQLKELTEVVVRFDTELLSERIKYGEYIPQTLLEIEQLIAFTVRYKMVYLTNEIVDLKNYIKKKYYNSKGGFNN